MKNWILILAALTLGFLVCDVASAQDCKNGVCSLPSAVKEVVSAPVQLTKQVVASQPVRKVVLRPFRLFRRCR
jgi:hypothetical protein